MERTGWGWHRDSILGALLVLLAVLLASGCGYMPRTGNQIQACMNDRDKALREEMAANKQELLTRIQEADQRLAAIDTRLADMDRTLDAMKGLESTMQSVRADMTGVRDDLRRVREDLHMSVRRELGSALMDAGRDLQSGSGSPGM